MLELECEFLRVRGPIAKGQGRASVAGETAVEAMLTVFVGERERMIGDARSDLHVTITGIGAYAPERVVTNDDISQLVDTSDEWIMERTGIRERRIAADSQALSDISLPGARQALEQAGSDGTDVDLLIVATVTPDMMFPSTSAILADQLGAKNAAAYDLSAGCTGFMYAVVQAYGMIAAGLSRRALVVGGDVLSRILDWSDRSTVVLFGDGAGAVVLEPSEEAGFLAFELGADGAGGEHLWLPGSGSRKFEDPERVREDERARGLQVRDARSRVVGRGGARALRRDRRGCRRLRPAPGECPHHRPRNQEARDPVGSGGD